ncbi:hypothetical protein [Cupriavidus plantarum]|uniref:Uncharacterized protein n=1 Tax=Cupriavidus plantarum TaxID=942865 RepID=A0A316EMP0_9BURK|nr:hypothetical protein [Cupriavidus plantarum]NYI01635.1 hypothetical protein [Cupriavidus plantarum]PWK33771.1 hypothetical protein C7419_10390 [Cupriavidus plantarum]REE90950.1 hypothetical protein C7418_4248 [Cupriavidus plantarum]RLK33622.1 hypothetical protein C7417_4271 [Cupriavidus plantarum]CAG2148420.1 hypothetical protein LMG26296_04334 [Cupriavidus plantarum]
MKHSESSIRHPAPKPTQSERGQNPAAEADADGAPGKGKPTSNEIMNEQSSPRDEQGNRDQSDKPHVSG